MKKRDVVALIRYHAEHNEPGFKAAAYTVANCFEEMGDHELAHYVMSLVTDPNAFVPQSGFNDITDTIEDIKYLQKISTSENQPLLLPQVITDDIIGVANAIKRELGICKFLFQGKPGTGKTEAVKQLGRMLKKDVYSVDFTQIIDSKLGQTSKNLSELFKEITAINTCNKCIILFDEIDALALDRTNSNDLREMGRVTSTLLKYLDSLPKDIVIIATTNLYEHFDKALTRRFDAVINFDRYTQSDLLEIGESILNRYLDKVKICKKNSRLFKKIMTSFKKIPYPGELSNIIKTSVAFSDPHDPEDYLRRLYHVVTDNVIYDLRQLQDLKFTIREIAVLINKSKSVVDRELKEITNDE